jgi:hypothetical protein
MTDDEIRAVVRQVLAARNLQPVQTRPEGPHPSHVRLSMVVPTPAGSPCVIEPAVTCNNCGYCLSAGH